MSFLLVLVLLTSCDSAAVPKPEQSDDQTTHIAEISDDTVRHVIDFVYTLYAQEEQLIPYEYDVGNHAISPYDIRINVRAEDIIVHLLAENGESSSFFSVDYSLTMEDGDSLAVRDVTAYSDDRNDCDHAITVEGVTVELPLVDVSMNGTHRYAVNHKTVKTTSSTFPDDPLTIQPFHYNKSKPNSLFLQNGQLYISIQHYGICDVYVYDMTDETGEWMSGAVSLDEDYAEEIAWMREHEAYFNYTRNEIAAISEGTGWFAVRRSTELGTHHGAYYLYHPDTGEELFVCESFPGERYATSDWEQVLVQPNGFAFRVCPTSAEGMTYTANITEGGWEIMSNP